MQIFSQPEALRQQCDAWRKQGQTLALVPTMGYYHAGHENLIRAGRNLADKLIVSLFVNPAQFGPGEDLDAYPRDLDRDKAMAEACGADALFIPQPEDMYAADHSTWVETPELGSGLCGKSRPIHFRGVCTIVLKLFMITFPNFAVFGQKDWQQQAIIKRMARDFNLPIQIETIATVREADGLALSSRNVYLSPEEREQAPEILQGLLLARRLVQQGEKNASRLRHAVLARWAQKLPLGRLDYLSVVHPETLEPLENIENSSLMACAVRLGKARLIDNILLN